ncbi:hypothetical protein HK101_005407, partial [Irineochytrium annulatum]
HLLIPAPLDETSQIRNEAEKLACDSDKAEYVAELSLLSEQLSFKPNVHLITLKNFKADIDSIPFTDLIFNLCDGCDIDGIPGPSIAQYLEEKQYPNVVGCDLLFINNTLTKNGMKAIFRENLVATPPGFGVTKDTNLEEEVANWGMTYPLFVKISDSYGSVGLDERSVCHSLEDLQSKVESLLKDFENLTVEEFIEGQEFSVLISGSCRDENQAVIVYPPAERAFQKDLPKYKRFITFESNWDVELQLHHYAQVEDENDSAALQDLARRAYIATNGNCFGRVDIRKRDSSGKFYVLEVNASCGIGSGSSSDFILKLAGQSTSDFFKILLSNFLQPAPLLDEAGKLAAEPSSLDDVEPVLPPHVESEVTALLKNPQLAVLPTPVVHVVVAAVIIDAEAGTVDPNGKLAHTFGKDVAYQSELETIFRAIGYDPILHIFRYEEVEEALSSLSREDDVVFNAALGQDGVEIAGLINKLGFTRTVGMNAKFFEVSQDRAKMQELLLKSNLSVPTCVTCTASSDVITAIEDAGISFPVYIKPTMISDGLEEGLNTGQMVHDPETLKNIMSSLPPESKVRVEEYIVGT